MTRGDHKRAAEFMARARDYWKNLGGRVTPGKAAVCRLVAAKDSAFTVETLWEEARRQGCKVSLSALYRTVNDLQAADLIREMHHAGGHRSFITTFAAPAPHLRCRICGRIDSVDEPLLVDVIRTVAGNSGFKMERIFIQIESECVSCGDAAE
ncbi:MAG: hypothetical protein EOP88_26955 [Verrucomicrobiaceae bacterium]|nr:MAG: hypothetical protein EOP88_26955 [Verrucomicrobiaceae bacterium]